MKKRISKMCANFSGAQYSLLRYLEPDKNCNKNICNYSILSAPLYSTNTLVLVLFLWSRMPCIKLLLFENNQCALFIRLLMTLAEGFYSPYRSLHHTPLSDINFESLLFSTDSNQSVWIFALLISLIDRKLFEIGWRKVWYPKLVYTP